MHGEYSHNCHRRIILVYSFHTWRSDVEATTILNTSAFTMSSRANETALFSDVSLLSTLNLRASPFVGRAFERSGIVPFSPLSFSFPESGKARKS